MINHNYENSISAANLAFGGGQYEESLKYAKKAIEDNRNNPEGYLCAGKACMSMDKAADAVKYLTEAVKLDGKNGNGFFLLGYAQMLDQNPGDALKNFTKAIESGTCDNTLKAQIYKMVAMLNVNQELYEDALINLDLAEEYTGLDYELLQQKAACHAFLKNYRSTIFTLNQMKLLQPREYLAYSLAFNLFMELELFDEAKDELERAEKYAHHDITYYNDRIIYSLVSGSNGEQTAEEIEARYEKTLVAINEALEKGRPEAPHVIELYLRAAQLYISLTKYNKALECIDAANNPVFSFNNGFSVLSDTPSDESNEIANELNDFTEEQIKELEQIDIEKDYEKNQFAGLEENIAYMIDNEEYFDLDELTPDDLFAEETESDAYTISEDFSPDEMQSDLINSLYITVYEATKDYVRMLEKAKLLRGSTIHGNRQSGIYYALKAKKYKNEDSWKTCYNDQINRWTKNTIEDPADFISASYRIRAYVDLGDDESIGKARSLCACLPNEIKDTLLSELPDLNNK